MAKSDRFLPAPATQLLSYLATLWFALAAVACSSTPSIPTITLNETAVEVAGMSRETLRALDDLVRRSEYPASPAGDRRHASERPSGLP